MPVSTKRVLAQIGEELSHRGFTGHKNAIYTKQIAETVLGWIGLNRAVHGGTVSINMVVGVRESRIEEREAELLGRKADLVSPPTIAANVGYLGPSRHYLNAHFDDDETVENETQELMAAFDKWGIPFMQRNDSVSAIIETMKTANYLARFYIGYKLPLALLIVDKMSEAISVVTENVAQRSARTDAEAQLYRKFAKALFPNLF